MARKEITQIIAILIFLNLLLIGISADSPVEANRELPEDEIPVLDAVARADTRAVTLMEQNAHGGSWVDSFEDDSGIDTGASDNVNYSGGLAKLADTGYVKVFEDDFSTPLDTGKWINDTGGGTTLYTHPELKAVKSGAAQTKHAYLTTKPSWNPQRIVEWNWNSVYDSHTNGYGHSIYVFNGTGKVLYVGVLASRGVVVGDAIVYYLYNTPVPIGANLWYRMRMIIEMDHADFEIRDMSNNLIYQSIIISDIFPITETGSCNFIFASQSGSAGLSFESRVDDFVVYEKKYQTSGNLTSKVIELPTDMRWDKLNVQRSMPTATSMRITIIDASTGMPVTNFQSLNFNGGLDISELNSMGIKTIRLKAELAGDSILTPELDHWGVSWNASNAWRDSLFDGTKFDISNKIHRIDGNVRSERSGIDPNASAFWHFDENAGSTVADSTGNNNDGMISGATWTNGKYGKALRFDGFNDFINVEPDNSVNVHDEMTIEAWVKPSSLGGLQTIMSRNLGSGSSQYGFGFDGTELDVGIVDDDRYFWHDNVGSFSSGNWYHIVSTYSEQSNNYEIYSNGISIASGTLTTQSRTDIWGDLNIGRDNRNQCHFYGVIDEVAIYDRALSAQEIQDRYENGPYTYQIGYLISKPISIPSETYWDTLIINKTVPTNTSINISIIDPVSNLPITSFEDMENTTIDISSVDPKLYPSIKLMATYMPDNYRTPVLHDWSVNWTGNTPPRDLALAPNNTQLNRTETTWIKIMVNDPQSTDDSLDVELKQKHEDSDVWHQTYLSNLRYGPDSWYIDFNPVDTATTGMYDFKLTCIDDFGESCTVIFEDLLEVRNNLPGAPELEIDPERPRTTDDITIRAKNSFDIEDEDVKYFYRWYKNDELQEDLTGIIVTSSYTAKGEEWRCEVTPNDGNPDGNGTRNSTSVIIQNSPPAIGKELWSIQMREDKIDNTSIDLAVVFTDADSDHLSYEITPSDNIDVAVGSSGTQIILTPAENWFGTEYIAFTANDTESETTITIMIDVWAQNDPPRIVRVSGVELMPDVKKLDYNVFEDEELRLTFVTEDIDGDTVTITSNRTDRNNVLDNILKMQIQRNELIFNPDNLLVGTIPVDLILSDSNGSTVHYDLVIKVVNTNDPPTVSITYPLDNMQFTEGDKIDFMCDYIDPDLLVPDSTEVLYFRWTSNLYNKPLGEGEDLDVLKGVKLKPGTHMITLTVVDKNWEQSTDVVIITVTEEEETGMGNFLGSAAGAIMIVLIIVVIMILLLYFMVLRKRRMRVDAEHIPAGEKPALKAYVVKPGRITPPTVTLDEMGEAAQPEQLPAAEGTAAEVTAEPQAQPGPASAQGPAPVPAQAQAPAPAQAQVPAQPATSTALAPVQPPPPAAAGQAQVRPVQPIVVSAADQFPMFTLEGGPQSVHGASLYQDVCEAREDEPPGMDAVIADLETAGIIKPTREATVDFESDSSVWKPGDSSKRKEEERKAELERSDVILKQIEKLGQLKEKGFITEEEFQQKKSELLK